MLYTDALKFPDNTMALLAALAAGLVIGLERGWRGREMADGGRVAGLRTFALVGLLGAVLCVAGPMMLAAGTLGVAVLGAVSYRESVRATGDLSATSSIALLLTFGLGALAGQGSPALALGMAVLVAVLLDLRSTLHQWLRVIEHQELRAALQMLVLSAVVLPLLPDAAYGPYGALNPYRLWWAVVLVAGLSLSGHVAMRLAGPQRGTLWTGLLGGLASSTAATLALSRQVQAHATLHESALAGIWSACAVMFLRMTIIVMTLAPALGRTLMGPMLAAGFVLFAAGLIQWKRRKAMPPDAVDAAQMRPFDLGTALGFGAFLGLMSVLTEASKAWLGEGGLYGLALVSGLADVDAITVSMASMSAHGSVSLTVGALAISLAIVSNMVTKVGIAWVTGGATLGRQVALGYALAMLVAGGTLALSAG